MHNMTLANFNDLDLGDAWYENDPAMHVKVNFPFSAATGNQSTAVVYFEIEPGHYLGTHTDSAEEILLILAGTVEVTLRDERGEASVGQAALIPALAPHGVRNIGNETARCAGFFSSAIVASTFEQALMPFGTRIVDTPPVASAV
jgi:quercetin dioxygenase-like cupin family protein